MAELPLVYGTGLSGLVGSKIVEALSDRYRFVNLDLSRGVDILNSETLEKVIQEEGPGVALIHLAAFTDVNAAQEQNGDTSGPAYQVNVVGTENIARLCKQHGLHLIHISTSYVFDGSKTEAYTEEDTPNPSEWYGATKLEAEKIIEHLLPDSTILRISFPYRKDDFPKLDMWRKIVAALQEGKTGPFFSDHRFTLTPLDWFTKVMDWAIREKPTGIFHATTEKIYTDFDLAREIAQEIGATQELQAGSLVEYNATASRQYQVNLVLSNEKLKQAMGNEYPTI
jgi:dTDP-4-dehydrorhamnose reductase